MRKTPESLPTQTYQMSRRAFIRRALTYGGRTAIAVGLSTSAVEYFEPIIRNQDRKQAKEEYADPIPREDYDAARSYVTRGDTLIITHADNQEYEAVRAISEDPQRADAKKKVTVFEANSDRQWKRERELFNQATPRKLGEMALALAGLGTLFVRDIFFDHKNPNARTQQIANPQA